MKIKRRKRVAQVQGEETPCFYVLDIEASGRSGRWGTTPIGNALHQIRIDISERLRGRPTDKSTGSLRNVPKTVSTAPATLTAKLQTASGAKTNQTRSAGGDSPVLILFRFLLTERDVTNEHAIELGTSQTCFVVIVLPLWSIGSLQQQQKRRDGNSAAHGLIASADSDWHFFPLSSISAT